MNAAKRSRALICAVLLCANNAAFGETWEPWTTVYNNPFIAGTIAAVSRKDMHVDLVARQTDGKLIHAAWDGARFWDWTLISTTPVSSDPTLIVRDVNTLEVLARGGIGKSNGLFHRLRAPTLHHREPRQGVSGSAAVQAASRPPDGGGVARRAGAG